MAKMMKTTLAILIIVSLVLAVASCGGGGGGNSPKSLAKQNYEVMTEIMKLMEGGAQTTDPKVAELMKKSEAIDEKVRQLSEEDAKIFVEEAQRLLEAAGN
jgi:hypothetical protein